MLQYSMSRYVYVPVGNKALLPSVTVVPIITIMDVESWGNGGDASPAVEKSAGDVP